MPRSRAIAHPAFSGDRRAPPASVRPPNEPLDRSLPADATARASAPRWTVVPLRLYLGAAFLEALTNKVGPGRWSSWPPWMHDYVAKLAPHVVPFYRPMLTGLVIPHANFFAPLAAVGEVAVGAALFLGGGTRLAAACGILLTINYFLLNGLTVVDVSNDFAILTGCAVVLLTAAGRTLTRRLLGATLAASAHLVIAISY